MSKPIIPETPGGVWTVVTLWSCHISDAGASEHPRLPPLVSGSLGEEILGGERRDLHPAGIAVRRPSKLRDLRGSDRHLPPE